MDSIDSLLAIDLPLSDSEEESGSTSSTSLNIEEDAETDLEDDVNNEDDQMDPVSDDDEVDETVLYVEEVINSTSSASRYDTITNNVTTTAAPQTPAQLPIALTYTTALPPTPSAAKTSRFVSASSAAATPAPAAVPKGPTAPVIVTATPLPSLGPLRPQTEYEPAASVMATRLSAQYTDTLRRRAETLIQKRLRFQKESVQKAKEMRQLTARLAQLNSRLADELVEQKRLIADYERIRETAQRALGVLHIVRDAETVLADTKNCLLATLSDRDERRHSQHHQPLLTATASPATDDNDDDDKGLTATAACDPLGLD